jgi:ABC-type branched-subunit amino acid transport system substrate-binding protein
MRLSVAERITIRHVGAEFRFDFHRLNFYATKCRVMLGLTPNRRGGSAVLGSAPIHGGALMRALRRLLPPLTMIAAAAALAACTSTNLSNLGTEPPPAQPTEVEPGAQIGTGQIRVALILPLSAPGNAGVAALSMKNAAEMALAEFKNPNIQLLVKDDGGNPQSAQLAAQQAIGEGAEIIVGPLFAQAVNAVGVVARQRGIPVIAFSTDASVATRGVYLLSFLPETDVRRIVDYQIASGKRSFAALLPDNAYGAVVQGTFQQEVASRGGRVLTIEKYPLDASKLAEPVQRVAQVANQVDNIFIPDGADAVPQVVRALQANRVNLKRVQLLGTGLWDDPRIFADRSLEGALYAAPESEGFRNFSARYRARFNQDPVRTATLAYDAVALVAALVKTQGAQRFSERVLLNSSGFSGIDGVFRFRPDGTNERGLAVLRVTPAGGQVVSPAPRSFRPGT